MTTPKGPAARRDHPRRGFDGPSVKARSDYEELVTAFAAEVLAAFRHADPFAMPLGESEVGRAYREATRVVSDHLRTADERRRYERFLAGCGFGRASEAGTLTRT